MNEMNGPASGRNGSAHASLATVIPPNGGTPLWVLGDRITIKVTGEQTGGALAVWENTTPPGAGSPPHIHHREDEAFLVLEGTYEFMLEGRSERAETGTLVYVPRGAVHMFRNVGDTPARALAWVTPAGFERFLLEVGHPAAEEVPPDIEAAIAAAKRHALEVIGPAIPDGGHSDNPVAGAPSGAAGS